MRDAAVPRERERENDAKSFEELFCSDDFFSIFRRKKNKKGKKNFLITPALSFLLLQNKSNAATPNRLPRLLGIRSPPPLWLELGFFRNNDPGAPLSFGGGGGDRRRALLQACPRRRAPGVFCFFRRLWKEKRRQQAHARGRRPGVRPGLRLQRQPGLEKTALRGVRESAAGARRPRRDRRGRARRRRLCLWRAEALGRGDRAGVCEVPRRQGEEEEEEGEEREREREFLPLFSTSTSAEEKNSKKTKTRKQNSETVDLHGGPRPRRAHQVRWRAGPRGAVRQVPGGRARRELDLCEAALNMIFLFCFFFRKREKKEREKKRENGIFFWF